MAVRFVGPPALYSRAMPTDRFSNWPEEYAAKLMDPADALLLVQSGDRVAIPIGAITPVLCQALFERGSAIQDIEILTCAPFIDPGWFEPGHPSFRVKVEVFNTLVGRAAVNEHRAEFVTVP